MSSSRQIIGGTIPAIQDVNSVKNRNIRDVIGQKNDTHSGNSIYSISDRLDDHVHTAQAPYPTLADSVTVTSSASAWTLGSFVEIVPVNTIIGDFDIHFIILSSISANDEYELVLYAGTTLITCIAFVKSAAGEPSIPLTTQSPINPANTQIQAKLASKAALARTVDVKILYHLY